MFSNVPSSALSSSHFYNQCKNHWNTAGGTKESYTYTYVKWTLLDKWYDPGYIKQKSLKHIWYEFCLMMYFLM